MLTFSDNLRSSMANQFTTELGLPCSLQLFQGVLPYSPETSNVGDILIAEFNFTSTFLNEAAGVLTIYGTWSSSALVAGTANYFRFIASDNITCTSQGSIGYSSEYIWANDTDFVTGQTVLSGLSVYVASTTGTTSISGYGPSGTTPYVDGDITWIYIGQSGDLNFISPVFTLNEPITINNFQLAIGNAPI